MLILALNTSERTTLQAPVDQEDQVGQQGQEFPWVQVIQVLLGVLAVPVFPLALWAQVIPPYPELPYHLSDLFPLEGLATRKTLWLL